MGAHSGKISAGSHDLNKWLFGGYDMHISEEQRKKIQEELKTSFKREFTCEREEGFAFVYGMD